MTPTVSVLIPVYNRQEYLRSCLWSVLRQTFQDFEVIVSDDHSQVDLKQVCNGFNDSRVVYHRHDRNVGACRNNIYAASLARGRFLKFVDSDDLLLPVCLERCLNETEALGADAVIYKTASFTDSGLRDGGAYSLPATGLVTKASWSTHRAILDFYNTSPTTMFIKKDIFWKVGGYTNWLRIAFDQDFYVRLLEEGDKVLFLDEVLSINRQHSGNIARTSVLSGDLLSDVLVWRRHTSAGRRLGYQSLIFNHLRQCQVEGASARPVLRAITQYGYSMETVFLLPLVAAARLCRRLGKTMGIARPEPEITKVTWPKEELDQLFAMWNARPDALKNKPDVQ